MIIDALNHFKDYQNLSKLYSEGKIYSLGNTVGKSDTQLKRFKNEYPKMWIETKYIGNNSFLILHNENNNVEEKLEQYYANSLKEEIDDCIIQDWQYGFYFNGKDWETVFDFNSLNKSNEIIKTLDEDHQSWLKTKQYR